MYSTMHKLGLAAVITAGTVGASAWIAAATGVPRVRTFRVEVQGVQTTSWTENHHSTAMCDPAATGSGRETLRFRSQRPDTIVAYRVGRNMVAIGPAGRADGELVVRASVTRHGHVTVAPSDPRCGGVGGGGVPPAPDCGSRRELFDLSLEWAASRPSGISLGNGTIVPLGGLFQNCPVIGDAYPRILDTVHGKAIVARIPAADLFDRSLRKHIVIGRGRERRPSADSTSTTSIRWTVSLTAVR